MNSTADHNKNLLYREPALPQVHYAELKDGSRGIAIDEEHLFLAVERADDYWRVKLFDLYGEKNPLTAWITIKDVEDLRIVKSAKALRDELKRQYPGSAHIILERMIMIIQDNADKWQPEQSEGQAGKSVKGLVNHGHEGADPEVAKQVEKLLRDPELLCHIATVLHEELGLVGETKNALLTYLTMISSRLEDPINLRWSGRASIGKSTIVTRVAQLFPLEDLIIRGGLTKKSLYYLPEAEDVDENTRRLKLKGKVLIVLEESESKEFLNEVKPLLSHDVPILKYSFVEEKVTRTVLLEGWPAYIGVTAEPMKGEEHETRALLASPDRGKEKYGAVVADDAERHAFPWIFKEPRLEAFHELVRRLKPLRVWMPWLPVVAKYFPTDRAGSMRDWKKFRTYIEAVAFLHQYQRPHVTFNGVEYVVASPLDLEITVHIIEGAMAETMLGLERDVKEFYDVLREEQKESFTYRELMGLYERHFGEPIARSTLRTRYVEKLEELGLLEADTSKKPYKFTVSSESLAGLADLEKMVSAVKSEETKAEIIRKTLARQECVQDSHIKEVITCVYGYTLSSCANLKRLLERSKSEEYSGERLFFDSAKPANDLAEKKPKCEGLLIRGKTPPSSTLNLLHFLGEGEESFSLQGRLHSASKEAVKASNVHSMFQPKRFGGVGEEPPSWLRVPRGLEGFMCAVKVDGVWMLQCKLCAKTGERFFTGNIDDMMLHIQRFHRELTQPPSAESPLQVKGAETYLSVEAVTAAPSTETVPNSILSEQFKSKDAFEVSSMPTANSETWRPPESAAANLAAAKRKHQTLRGVAYKFDLGRVKEKAQARDVVLERAPSGPVAGRNGEGGGVNYGECVVCGKFGAPGILRNGRWIYLHPECSEDYMGPL